MKKLNKVFVVLLFAVAIMLLLTVNASAMVDSSLVTNEVKTITFDAEYYLNAYSDLKAAYGDDEEEAYAHFLAFGISEGRCAKLTFDVGYYLNSYKDLQDAFGNDYEAAYKHFIEFGASEGRSGCPIYDSEYYTENNKDVKEAYGDNNLKVYEHYVVFGINEGRQACDEFNVKCYLKKYKDLTEAFTATGYAEGFEHFLIFGFDEGRVGTHEYETTTVEATCTEDGYTLQECACGDTIRTTLSALGHSFGGTTEVTSEDAEAGNYVHKHTCTREGCGATEYFDEAHSYGEEPTETSATCTEAGKETYTCSVCSKEDVRDVDAYGHNYVLNTGDRVTGTSPATCSIAGYDEYICSRCNITRLVRVPATGEHDLTEVPAKAATCTEAGNNAYYICSGCSEAFKDAEGTQSTTVDAETIQATGHKLTEVPAKAASCTEAGNNAYYTCSGGCKLIFKADKTTTTTVEAETIQATGHTIVAGTEDDYEKYGIKAPTCTESGYVITGVCSNCDDVVEVTAADALGHDLELVPATDATSTTTGNNAYYKCSRCSRLFKDAEGTQSTTVEAETIPVTVTTLSELKSAISEDSDITTVALGANIDINETLSVTKAMTIIGNGYGLNFANVPATGPNAEVESGLVILASDTTLDNLKVSITSDTDWQGNYAIQVYNATGVVLNNVTTSNGDAGILVNGSEVELTGTTTIENSEFGGIEVSKGSATGLKNSILTVIGTISMPNEGTINVAGNAIPAIWVVNGQGSLAGDGIINYTDVPMGEQTYYYADATKVPQQ